MVHILGHFLVDSEYDGMVLIASLQLFILCKKMYFKLWHIQKESMQKK